MAARVVIFMLFDKRSCESWEVLFISYHGSLGDVHHKVLLPMKIEEMRSGRDMYVQDSSTALQSFENEGRSFVTSLGADWQ